MIDEANKIKFLRDGLVQYPGARETVDYFETSVKDAIVAALKAKTSWKNFQPQRDSEGNLQSLRTFIGPVERIIQASLAGALPNRSSGKESVTLYFFLYWNSRFLPKSRVVAACVAWSETGPVKLADLPGRDRRVALDLVKKSGERCLLLELQPPEDFDPADDFRLLLDSIDEAMGGR